MRRVMFLFVVFAMLIAACGGDTDADDGADGGQPTPTTVADDGSSEEPPPTAPPPNTSGDDDGDPSDGTGPSTATVTIGDETYEFSSEGALVAQCLPDLFGTMSVQLPLAGDNSAGISLFALHEGTDPSVVGQNNAIEVSLPDANWVADPEDVRIAGNADYEGLSQVDSVEVDGNTVTGTATFVNTDNFGEVESASGTFEATCGEERTS